MLFTSSLLHRSLPAVSARLVWARERRAASDTNDRNRDRLSSRGKPKLARGQTAGHTGENQDLRNSRGQRGELKG